MLPNKEEFIAKLAPTLMKAIKYPDHETVVDHTYIRAKLMADKLEEKGAFEDLSESPYRKYVFEAACEILQSLENPDPNTAVDHSCLRAEMLARRLLPIEMHDAIFMPKSAMAKMDLQANVKQTPTESIVKHQSW